jgi:N4-(beta-N-acetylglucosaminyl)-L-asparaginase
MTEEAVRRYEQYLARPEVREAYVHTSHDTVTMLGQDEGRFVAASSTSGIGFKMPGRVGDSPIVGAGIYADDEAGAAGATGLGEELWKACASFRAVEHMRQGKSAQEACEAVVRQMMRRQPGSLQIACVVLALGRHGDFGAATTKGVFHLWRHHEGETTVHEYAALEP